MVAEPEVYEYYGGAPAAPPVGVGAPAPDVTVEDARGGPVRLADLWRRGPIVLVFIRHLGCMFCREHVAHLRDRYAAFQAAGAQVVVIGMGTPTQTRAFIEAHHLPFPVLSDPIRRSHR